MCCDLNFIFYFAISERSKKSSYYSNLCIKIKFQCYITILFEQNLEQNREQNFEQNLEQSNEQNQEQNLEQNPEQTC